MVRRWGCGRTAPPRWPKPTRMPISPGSAAATPICGSSRSRASGPIPCSIRRFCRNPRGVVMTVKRSAPSPAPAHPDVEILGVEIGFARHLGVEIVRFRHRLFAGGWSGERVFDVVRRGAAAAVLLYDPVRDSVVLIEQFRVAALFAGRSPWQVEAVAGLIDSDETPQEVGRGEAAGEANLDPLGPLLPIQTMMPATGSLDEAVFLYCGRVDCRA